MIKLSHTGADVHIPDSLSYPAALERTTHLAVGAHQDDLEFMAMHGILECYDSNDNWFGGVICADGAGSSRTGRYADVTDEQMQTIRAEEQREASRIGKYGFVAQLNFPSTAIKRIVNNQLIGDLVNILRVTSPKIVYTHNLADKHGTHVAVTLSLIEAIRSMKPIERPNRLIGCEVWRDLDWLPDSEKVIMDVGANPELSAKLNATFDSQISGGKRYDLAVEGRRRANATFLNSHSADQFKSVCLGLDLTPLIKNDSLIPTDYILKFIENFKADVAGQISALTQ